MIRCLNCMNMFDEVYGVCPHCGFIPGSPPKEAYHLFPGTVLKDRYIVGTTVGFGGCGITYRACDSRLDKMVAIKEFYPYGLVDVYKRQRGIWVISAMALMAASEGIMAWMVVRWCRREQLKEQIQEFKYMEQMNQTRDLVARQRRQEAKELREKLWKELQKAKEIIRESAGGEENGGLSEGASSAFQGLLQDARAQAEQEVCENALVNTVLEEKKRFCQTFGIHLSVQVEEMCIRDRMYIFLPA